MEQFKVCLWLHSGEYLEKHFATEADARKVMESMWMVPQVCKVHLCLVRVLEARGPRQQELAPDWNKGWTKIPPQNSDK